jgi:uncharacterized membrane protein
MWQGQFPPPEAIERYEKVLPGSFDRIIKMAEGLQAAQIASSITAMNYTQQDTRRGHWLGFSVTCLSMLAAIAALLLQYPWIAGAFFGVPVMSVARALVESAKAPSTSELAKVVSEEVAPSTSPGSSPASAPSQRPSSS